MTEYLSGVQRVEDGNRIFRMFNADSLVNVNSNAVELIKIIPTKGYKARITGFYCAVTGVTNGTGNHSFRLYLGSSEARGSLGLFEGVQTSNLSYAFGELRTGTLTVPSTKEQLNKNIIGCEFSENVPLYVKYTNGGLSHSNGRAITLIVEEVLIK